jgi:tetratricopeptide (TPR) repeat protein
MARLKSKPIAVAVAFCLLVLTTGESRAAEPKEKKAPRQADVKKIEVEKKERAPVVLPQQTRTYREKTPPDKQEKARKLFRLANQRFEQRRHDEALKLYRQAYGQWPHPRILFNIAVCLGFLSQPLESAETFKQVLHYGPEPINPERYKQASERYTELMGQLAQLVVVCDEPDTKVFVDGKPIGMAPLSKKVTLGPGTHMVTANREGKVPYSAQVRLEPGSHSKIDISLQAFTEMVKEVDRYHWSVPTSVTAATAAFLGVGLGLLFQGRSDVDDLQADINQKIREQGTGLTFEYDTGLENRAVNMQIAGQALLGVAAAAGVAATVLWLVRKKQVNVAEEKAAKKKRKTGADVEINF